MRSIPSSVHAGGMTRSLQRCRFVSQRLPCSSRNTLSSPARRLVQPGRPRTTAQAWHAGTVPCALAPRSSDQVLTQAAITPTPAAISHDADQPGRGRRVRTLAGRCAARSAAASRPVELGVGPAASTGARRGWRRSATARSDPRRQGDRSTGACRPSELSVDGRRPAPTAMPSPCCWLGQVDVADQRQRRERVDERPRVVAQRPGARRRARTRRRSRARPPSRPVRNRFGASSAQRRAGRRRRSRRRRPW